MGERAGITELLAALNAGLLSKLEARAVVLSFYPQARALGDAKQLLEGLEEEN